MGRKVKIGCLSIAGVFVLLVVIGALADKGKEEKAAIASAPSSAASIPEQGGGQSEQREAETEQPSLTGPQSNAARSATQYLSISGFSRRGLIEQLSSGSGDGYNVADATAAVDSLSVNWDEQAARSAKQYLEMSGFSCKGLIEQLSSAAGDRYTASQAAYGAKQAGAC